MNGILQRVAVIVCFFFTCSHAASGESFRIVATDQGLEAPRAMPAGLRHIVFENQGTQIHEAMLIKLPAGLSVEGFRAKIKEGELFPEGTRDYSGPGLMSGGEVTELWLQTDPGEYVLMCWNHDSARNGDSVRGLTVTSDKRVDETPPKEDAVLTLRDFRFELQGRLKKGVQVVRVESLGPSIHEADLFRLRPGRSAKDIQSWYKGDHEEAAPAQALGGVLDSHDTKRVVWLRRAFTPGQYVFHCGIPMNLHTKSGEHSPLHADAGMVMTFEIGP